MGSASSNRVDPLYLKVATPRVTDSGRNALPSAKDLFKGLSLSSQFKVSLHLNRNVTGANNLDGHLTRSGIFDDYSSSSMSYDFFASEAILPGVNFDMTEQPGSYQGMLEYMPTRRVWPDFEVTFYVDDQYNILRLFEEWVNYINPLYTVDGQYSGGFNAQDGMVDTNSYYKLRYPGKYKRKITITKFERSFFSNPNSSEGQPNQSLLSYQLIDAFPKQLTAIPVSYDGSTLSRVTVIFGYTRYITVKNNGSRTSSNGTVNNTVTNRKVYMPTQAIVTQARAQQRPLTEGAPQRKNNYPSTNTNYQSTQDLVDKDNATYGNSFPEGSFGVGSLASPSRLISKDNNAYGNTFPEGSFGIGSNVSLGRQIGVQLNKDQATYGNSVPSGSFGISNKGKQDSARNKAHKRDQERNSRRGSAAKNKGWWPF